jgi:hypothetical protein
MNKYNVGDVVLLKGTITEVDDEDREYPYEITFDNDGGCTWVSQPSIFALVQSAEPEAEPEPRFKVGDWVLPHGGRAPGQVVEVKTTLYKVQWDSYKIHWFAEELLQPAEPPKPEPKFKVDDWVRIDGYDEFGPVRIYRIHDYGSVPDLLKEPVYELNLSVGTSSVYMSARESKLRIAN